MDDAQRFVQSMRTHCVFANFQHLIEPISRVVRWGRLSERAEESLFILDGGVEVTAENEFHHPTGDEIWPTFAVLRHGAVGGYIPQLDGTPDWNWGTDLTYRLEDADDEAWIIDKADLVQALKPFRPEDNDGSLGHVRAIVGRVSRLRPTAQAFLGALRSFSNVTHGADAYQLLLEQRATLGEKAKVERFASDRVIVPSNEPAQRLYQAGPGTAFELRFPGDQTVYVLGPGTFVGFSAWKQVRKRGAGARYADGGVEITVLASRGHTTCSVLTWDLESLRELDTGGLRGGGWMDAFMMDRNALYQNAMSLLDKLQHHSLFEGVDRDRMLPLLSGSSLVKWAVGRPSPVPIGMEPGLCIINRGEVLGYHLYPRVARGSVRDLRFVPTSSHSARRPASAVVGGLSTVGTVLDLDDDDLLPEDEWRARMPAEGVFIYADRIKRVLRPVPVFERNCQRARNQLMESMHYHQVLSQLDSSHGQFHEDLNVLWFARADERAPQPLRVEDSVLLHELARRIRLDFGERTAIVELTLGDGEEPKLTWEDRPDGFDAVLALPDTYEGHIRGLKALGHQLSKEANAVQVFLWTKVRPLMHLSKLAAADGIVLLEHRSNPRTPTEMPRGVGLHYAALARVTDGALPPTAVRLHAVLEPNAPENGFCGRTEAYRRWARAVTGRRVGVALGGGGAWGWAHVAMLLAMDHREIPVDMVAGASFGAVAGAFYALGGKAGLKYALRNCDTLRRRVQRGMLFGSGLQRYFDELIVDMQKSAPAADLESLRYLPGPSNVVELQQTPIPFYPVVTDLAAGSQATILDQTIGYGVRASGALPPAFAVKLEANATFADGGLSENVPANVVEMEGASVIVASNIVPPPILRGAMATRLPKELSLLSDLDPIRRVAATVLGIQTLFNSAGQVDTGLAPIIFESEWNGKMFFEIAQAEQIVNATYATRSFWQAMDALERRWVHFKQPRVRH